MKRILTFGVFDYFHLGHLRLFKQCKEYADYLIVAVQNENHIKEFKPDARILYNTDERVEIIKAIGIVDEVLVYDTISVNTLELIDNRIGFEILGLGEDHIGERFDVVADWCVRNGKSVVRLNRTPRITSSEIKDYLQV